jgi:hypothetical protein
MNMRNYPMKNVIPKEIYVRRGQSQRDNYDRC